MFSFKDLEKVSLKATSNIEIGNKQFVPGETLAYFDKIQVAALDEQRDVRVAEGGYENQPRVFWETTKDLKLRFSQGVFSEEHFALLTNAKLIEQVGVPILISEQEDKETSELGVITLKHVPVGEIFVYNKNTGSRITNYTIDGATLTFATPFLEVLVRYTFNYTNKIYDYKIGRRLVNGFVELEGRTRIKDDVSGQVVTGIFKIPKLKLLSELSVKLGEQATPVVGKFDALCVPVGSRGNTYVTDFVILSDDIDSDL
jgi:hypothetical protein